MRPIPSAKLLLRATIELNNKAIILHLCCLLLLLNAACSDDATSRDERRASKRAKTAPSTERAAATNSGSYEPPVHLAVLADRSVDESSGIVASRLTPDLYWTHNDSGDGPFLYAFDRSGQSRGVWRVEGARALDWEDIAAGPGPVKGTSYLYIGDTGDNDREGKLITVYRVAEPPVESGASSSRANPLQTAPAEVIHLEYPDSRHDAEALLVHPRTGDLYVITKTRKAASKVYKATAPFDTATVIQLDFVSDLRLPTARSGEVTGADISPDGGRVVLCDYVGAYELSLPRGDADFDTIWQQPLAPVDLGLRSQGEGVCYRLDGKAILATSENAPSPLIEVRRKE
jgi:hypothetical protein